MDLVTKGISSLSVDKVAEGKLVVEGQTCCKTESYCGICAICLEDIVLEETAYVKGCEHAYCATCILRWASYSSVPCCPQCKVPFSSLSLHRSLDGCINDFLIEENVCLLLRATWFVPLTVGSQLESGNHEDDMAYDYAYYDDDEDDDNDGDIEEAYFGGSSTLRIGNRRWGDNGYIRGGRKEARPIVHPQCGRDVEAAGSSRGLRKEAASKGKTGRRSRRA